MHKNHRPAKKSWRLLQPTSAKAIAGLLAFTCLIGSSCKKIEHVAFPVEINKVNHVVVIYLENHSFDNLYGQYAGANGLSNATSSQITQVDSNGIPYTFLPPIPGTNAFPTNLPNNYFDIDQYIPNDMETPDVLHRYYQEQYQIDGGKMDKYALYNSSGGLSQGYYQTSMLPLLSTVQKYTLCDNFFHSAFGGSFLNHIWLIADASPVFPNAPQSMVI